MSSLKNKITRLKNRLYTKWIVPYKEKETVINDLHMHYLFYEKSESQALIIGLQAYHPDGPKYNYVTPLNKVKANRLYIKDDFCLPNGSFYLGKDFSFNIEYAVEEFIRKEIEETNAKKVILIGSSKGAYAALNIGFDIPGSVMVIAAPQYKVASYMYNVKKFNAALDYTIVPKRPSDLYDALNERLHEKIKQNDHSHIVYMHYSRNEDLYPSHIKPMLEDFEKYGVRYETHVGEYTDHFALKYYYPEYLIKTVNAILDA